ncbi:MAG: carbohydrate kinase family protein [Actinomycetales bacterium]|nr:carbohydrate kinase family protein [Actinomycetales bacterium]
MRIAVTGSVATDHLMTFDGRFADNLVAERLEKVSVSFLVSELHIRRGGVAANIAFGLGCLGVNPFLVAAAGTDFDEYRAWLERHGVDCGGVRISSTAHTSRFVCTTDRDQAQIASFYPGAMSEAKEIELAAVTGGQPLDLVVVCPNDPAAMLRHTRECRAAGVSFAADPSQQLTWSDGELVRDLIDGADYLFSNDYEAALIQRKTGWSDADVLARVGVRVTTYGEDGVVVESGTGGRRERTDGGPWRLEVPVVPARRIADPTGVGDAFRAGFLGGLAWGLDHRSCAELGSAMATLVIETVGTQEYVIEPGELAARIEAAYGPATAGEVERRLALVPER